MNKSLLAVALSIPLALAACSDRTERKADAAVDSAAADTQANINDVAIPDDGIVTTDDHTMVADAPVVDATTDTTAVVTSHDNTVTAPAAPVARTTTTTTTTTNNSAAANVGANAAVDAANAAADAANAAAKAANNAAAKAANNAHVDNASR